MKKVLIMDPVALGRGPAPWKKALDYGFVKLGWRVANLDDRRMLKPAGRNEDIVKMATKLFKAADLVVVADLANKPIDWPVFAEALKRSMTTWFTYTHVPEHRKATYITELYKRTWSAGFVATASQRDADLFIKRHGLIGHLKSLVLPNLPYVMGNIQYANAADGAVVCSSVISPMKGQLAIGKLAMHGHSVELWGEGMESPGGPESYMLLKKLVDIGFKIEEGAISNYNKELWRLSYFEQGKVAWMGSYEDPNVPLSRAIVHVNLTNIGRCYGHLEYTTIEAMEAGVSCVVPKHHLPEYISEIPGVVTVDYERPGKYDFGDLCKGVDTQRKAHRMSMEMTEYLKREHDPVTYVQTILDAC